MAQVQASPLCHSSAVLSARTPVPQHFHYAKREDGLPFPMAEFVCLNTCHRLPATAGRATCQSGFESAQPLSDIFHYF